MKLTVSLAFFAIRSDFLFFFSSFFGMTVIPIMDSSMWLTYESKFNQFNVLIHIYYLSLLWRHLLYEEKIFYLLIFVAFVLSLNLIINRCLWRS